MTTMQETTFGLLPRGDLYRIKPNSDMDKLFQAIGLNWQIIYDRMIAAKDYNNPANTSLLSDLEREFGQRTDLTLDEMVRRANLQARMFERYPQKSVDTVNEILQRAGFTNVFVFQNDPAVNPAGFVDRAFQMYADSEFSYAGHEGAFAGVTGGYYLVNTFLGTQKPAYLSQAGQMFAGNIDAVAGRYDEQITKSLIYETPTESEYWPAICFVAGGVTRDTGTGAITSVAYADVNGSTRYNLEKLLLRNLPFHQWAAMFINYI